ncbi:hypothetical protein NM208_g7548 [Fusarium decemcellulare]|uniref:Uncharacterized protein n=1 Tax=Fusarium decemcellulare TaxID=57161 RepID=A0ACC1S8W7_9HYPO|nr:hypothetical protein NM208_g7548 [Fusarium decemcellulare]
MHIANFSVLTMFVASAFAADCFGNSRNNIPQFKAAYYDAREKMCSNKECAFQQDCQTTASKRVGSSTLNVSLNRKRVGGGKGFKDCWDATEQIINQCVNDQKKPSGSWGFNNQVYEYNAWFGS